MAKRMVMERVWLCKTCKGHKCMLAMDQNLFPNSCIVFGSLSKADWRLQLTKTKSEEVPNEQTPGNHAPF